MAHSEYRSLIVVPMTVIRSSLGLIINKFLNVDTTYLSKYLRQLLMFYEPDQMLTTGREEPTSTITNELTASDLGNLYHRDLLQAPTFDGFDVEHFEITAEMFEAFTTLEPISSNVGSSP